MKVLIVSKTHMGNGRCCVGGLGVVQGPVLRSLRLLTCEGDKLVLANSPYEIGQVWELEFKRIGIKAPHVEDVRVCSRKLLRQATPEIGKTIFEKVKQPESGMKIWEGPPEVLFDGCLNATDGGSGFISEKGDIPDQSTGFWVADRDLERRDYKGKIRYRYPANSGIRYIKYVGVKEPDLTIIPQGTLLRVSLARWWQRSKDEEKRCFLQLSGWYPDTIPSQAGTTLALPSQPQLTQLSGDVTSNYSLNRCCTCGKMVLGFDRENHIHEVHAGQRVRFKKIR